MEKLAIVTKMVFHISDGKRVQPEDWETRGGGGGYIGMNKINDYCSEYPGGVVLLTEMGRIESNRIESKVDQKTGF